MHSDLWEFSPYINTHKNSTTENVFLSIKVKGVYVLNNAAKCIFWAKSWRHPVIPPNVSVILSQFWYSNKFLRRYIYSEGKLIVCLWPTYVSFFITYVHLCYVYYIIKMSRWFVKLSNFNAILWYFVRVLSFSSHVFI